MASVIINDYLESKRVKLFFVAEDFDLIEENWRERDQVLDGLQGLDFFKGRERWCDLAPAHFRLLVAKNLQHAAKLTEEERIDDDHPVVSSVNFLICGLIRCLEETSDIHIELLKINRVGEMEIAVEFEAAMRMEVVRRPVAPVVPPKKGDPFTVIVDNTPK